VTDPNNPLNIASFGAGPTFGIGVRTQSVVGLPGITTAPEEIGYYPQITTADKADVLTIELNKNFDTSGADSGLIFSYFFSGEGIASGEIMRYQLRDDGANVGTEQVVTAQNTGEFDWQNIPNALNSGTFLHKFPEFTGGDVVFDEIVITAGNGLSQDGTDALLEALIATDTGTVDPTEDPLVQRPMRIDFINNNCSCACVLPNDIQSRPWYNDVYPVVIYSQGVGGQALNPNNILDRSTIRLGITQADAVNDTNTIDPNPTLLANTNFRERDINGDGIKDMILYFDKSQANPLRNLPGFNGSVHVAAEGTIGANDFLFVGTDTVA
jgi:hypothetical protein